MLHPRYVARPLPAPSPSAAQAAVLAIANIYWGCLYMGEFGTWTWAVYTAWLVAIVLVSVVKDVSTYRR